MKHGTSLGLARRLCTLAAALLTLVLSGPAAAQAPSATPERIASFVQGRFIAQAGAIYYAARVQAQIDAQGELSLDAEVDPVFAIDLTEGAREGAGGSGGVAYYNLQIPPKAECGPKGLPIRLTGTDISVRTGLRFVNLRDALEASFKDVPPFSSTYRPFLFTEADLARVRACARSLAARIDTQPFESIAAYAGDRLVGEVRRTPETTTVIERDLENSDALTRIVIRPRPGRDAPFTVSVQGVAVMHCDYEGPHLELDHWQQGLSTERPLAAQGHVFAIGPDTLQTKVPPFPAYTQTQLRRAINEQRGEAGLAPRSEAAPCKPFLRGHRFIIRQGGAQVHEFSIYVPGGC